MEPFTLMLYFLVALVIGAIIWGFMLWIAVPPLPARIIILVFALIFLLWIAQNMGVKFGEIETWQIAYHLKLLHS